MHTPPFTSDISMRIYRTALSDGMPETLARFIVGQSKHETGHYLHKFARLYNSYFGYSYDKNSKWQSAPGTKADNNVKIAGYASLEDSVHELTSWIKRRQKEKKFPKDLSQIKTPIDYATYLQDSGYYAGWKQYSREKNRDLYAAGIKKGAEDGK